MSALSRSFATSRTSIAGAKDPWQFIKVFSLPIGALCPTETLNCNTEILGCTILPPKTTKWTIHLHIYTAVFLHTLAASLKAAQRYPTEVQTLVVGPK